MTGFAAVQLDREEPEGVRLGAFLSLVSGSSGVRMRLEEEASRAGVAPPEVYEVLGALEGGPRRMGEAAESLGISASGMTRRLERMERAGMVDRTTCLEDRRGTVAQITDGGREALARARPVYNAFIKRHFTDRITDGEAKQLAAIMKRVTDSFK